MLNGKLQLHDVRDVEAFTHRLLPNNPSLDPHEREDLHAYLIAECWELSLRYQPGGITFSTWARTTLNLRIIDWKRKRYGRTTWAFHDRIITRPNPRPRSLTELDQRGTVDAQADRHTDLAGLLRTGNSPPPRQTESLGRRPASRAA